MNTHTPPNDSQAKRGLRERKKAEARSLILHHAHRLIAEHGFDGVTMQQIAAKAGVAYQTLYNYFPSKARIALAFVEQASEQIETEFNVSQARNAWPGLVKLLDGLLEQQAQVWARHDKRLWRALVAEMFADAELIWPAIAGSEKRGLDYLHAWLAEAKSRRELASEVDTQKLARVLGFCMNSVGLQFIASNMSGAELLQHWRDDVSFSLAPYLVNCDQDHPGTLNTRRSS